MPPVSHPDDESEGFAFPIKWVVFGGGAVATLLMLIVIAKLVGSSGSSEAAHDSTAPAETRVAANYAGAPEPEEPPIAAVERQRDDEHPAKNGPPLPPTTPAAPQQAVAAAAPANLTRPSPGVNPTPPVAAQSATSQQTKIETKPRPQPPKPSPKPGGLTGMSTQFDDLHCRRIQLSFGVAIPDGATILEVDGDRLPVADVPQIQSGIAPILFLPKGTHAVQFAPGERPVEVTIADHLGATYEEMRRYFGLPDAVRSDELFSRGARAMDVHGAPFLLNFMGGSYASQGQWGAAERKFRRALRVNPAFAPAHLNLAKCFLERNDREGAVRELRLAEAFNVGNVFGLNAPIVALRRELGLAPDDRQPAAILAGEYIASDPLTLEDERMIALMEALGKYAVREEDRGKVLNNLAVHFADSDKTETGLEYFRKALASFKEAGPERFALAKKVLSHMQAACSKAGFEEADEYRRMQDAVRP